MNKLNHAPAYLCIVLIVSNCAGGSFPIGESTPTGSSSSIEQSDSVLTVSSPDKLPKPRQLVDAVRRAYLDLTYYRSKGVYKAREEFRGKRLERADVPLEIEYARGQNAVLRWNETDQQKVLTIVGKDSWVEVDGQRERTFSRPDDALGIAAQTEDGDYLFGIKFFVLRDELSLKNKFFVGLGKLETKGKDVVDGHPCYLLTGIFGNEDARRTYWIDKDSSLIRRIETVLVIRTMSEGKEYVSTTTTTETYTDIELRTGHAGT